MKKRSRVIEDTNLSKAWGQAFLTLFEPGVHEIVPLQVTIKEIDDNLPIEDMKIRTLLDKHLTSSRKFNCSTVAGTIFPISMWNPALPRSVLFDRYLSVLPAFKKFRQNRNGMYFERFISYGEDEFNQLEFILKSRTKEGNRRRSVLQASVMQPKKDLNNQPFCGFPCLQQISFAPFGNKELSVNGFYGTQYLYEKAYGNYLGLYHLGLFVAHELGLRLTQVSCFTGIGELGFPKSELRGLAAKIEKLL